ncbi:MAG: TIM barrel protein [Sedimentisphaerales bacterium]|nr:TIM barrel protein [Sedimentisphaerales bacterium]
MTQTERYNGNTPPPNRREILASAASVAAAMTGVGAPRLLAAEVESMVTKGRIKQSVCRWCFQKVAFEPFAEYCAGIGLKSIELVAPNDWGVLKKHGLICAMTPSHGIGKGLNRTENHAECLAAIRKSIDDTAEAGFPNVICFSGNRAGMDDEEGLANCAIALKQIVGYAEKKRIMICMELLNSKRNHKDYMCDRTHWGVKLVKQVGSDHFRLLYDIYHMQVQEGDVIATIRESKDCIGHYHTAGVPGRNEFDETQELYYPAIMKAIVETGFTGYVGQEFVPRRQDALASLAEAVKVCDV